MNAFQLEKYLLELEANNEIKGGADDGTKFEAVSGSKMQVHHPVYTRPIMSLYEYVGAMSTLAKFIGSQKSIAKFVDDIEVSALLNPAELALYLVRCKKLDCDIIRNHGAEVVSFSVLRKNPIFEKTMIEYYERKNQSMKQEFYDPISKLGKE